MPHHPLEATIQVIAARQLSRFFSDHLDSDPLDG
jgi:hypothetical protein